LSQVAEFNLLAKTVFGLEQTLALELESLGAREIKVLTRAVSFKGNQRLLYSSNYCCRTALRILKPILIFEIKEQQDLYEMIRDFPWENFLDNTGSLAVDAVISYTVFTNSQYVAQKTKDAVVDRLRDKSGSRPNVDLDKPDLRINVHLYKDLCTVSLDSSGSTLNKRGYRKSIGLAPINEVLAAGLISLSAWDKETPLLDPMCGSGTFLTEAAMMLRKIPAGHFRQEYGFMKWKDFDQALWSSVRAEADAGIISSAIRLFGMDRASRAIQSALENLQGVSLGDAVSLSQVNFEESKAPSLEGLIITNPPYDERLKLDDSIAFYQMIGNTLKRKYSGWEAWIISGDLQSIKFIGLKPSKKIPVFNGPIECRFLKFTLY
jgi:putative N6-adenine-specific DNA methylase